MSNQPNQLPRSVVIALDGESKCGKTTVIDAIAAEAEQLQLEPSDNAQFGSVIKVSAGNLYRGATLYKTMLEERGQTKERFEPGDAEPLKELLSQPGTEEVLQNDQAIGKQVSFVARMLGIQALCETLLCDIVLDAYHAGSGNLVIVDGRGPVDCFSRHTMIGDQKGQIHTATIMPVYIDTPAEDAAARLKGDFTDNLAIITARRTSDSTRSELPWTAPPVLTDDFDRWVRQFDPKTATREGLATPYRFFNGEGVTLDDVQQFSGMAALAALRLAHPSK